MMSLPPLYALRAFEAAARLNSFSKAAETLNITPGAVSRHVRTLELWFDCELFKRQGPRVEVSEAGRILAGQLSESFASMEWACRAFRSEHHLLRLKAPSSLTMWLLDALRTFRESHAKPKVEIASVWMDIDTVDFTREPYDCAILLGNGYFGEATESRLLFSEWLIRLRPLFAGICPASSSSVRSYPSLTGQTRLEKVAEKDGEISRTRREWRDCL
jgi:DNA-binding transcriptional LysR family regulator